MLHREGVVFVQYREVGLTSHNHHSIYVCINCNMVSITTNYQYNQYHNNQYLYRLYLLIYLHPFNLLSYMLLNYRVIEQSIMLLVIRLYIFIATIILCSISAIVSFLSFIYSKYLTIILDLRIFKEKQFQESKLIKKPWLLVDSFYQLLLPSKIPRAITFRKE